jgi:hypothetical protein
MNRESNIEQATSDFQRRTLRRGLGLWVSGGLSEKKNQPVCREDGFSIFAQGCAKFVAQIDDQLCRQECPDVSGSEGILSSSTWGYCALEGV